LFFFAICHNAGDYTEINTISHVILKKMQRNHYILFFEKLMP